MGRLLPLKFFFPAEFTGALAACMARVRGLKDPSDREFLASRLEWMDARLRETRQPDTARRSAGMPQRPLPIDVDICSGDGDSNGAAGRPHHNKVAARGIMQLSHQHYSEQLAALPTVWTAGLPLQHSPRRTRPAPAGRESDGEVPTRMAPAAGDASRGRMWLPPVPATRMGRPRGHGASQQYLQC